MTKILIIDDEQGITWAFEKFIKSIGYTPIIAATAEQGLEIFKRESPALVITDIKLPGMDGLSAVKEIKKLNSNVKVIVMTAYGTLDTAVSAVRIGAAEYITKPVDLSALRSAIDRILNSDKVEVSKESAEFLVPSSQLTTLNIIGRSTKMQDVFKAIAAVSDSDVNVLLVGESGTGKELVARAIHYNSNRRDKPFEPINCAAIPETLIESELYGYEKGAFTGATAQKIGKFEVANAGTLFLDEIGDMSVQAQAKLLRFLEDGYLQRVGGLDKVPIDVRVVAATNHNIDEMVSSSRLREDLYYRLSVVVITLPPLRDRKDDIPLLVSHFVKSSSIKLTGVSKDAMNILTAYHWPGNVRELKNVIERGLVISRGATIQPEHLPDSIRFPQDTVKDNIDVRIADIVDMLIADTKDIGNGAIFDNVSAKWEKALLKKVLAMCDGNQVKAHEKLGISRVTLRKKMEQYGLH